ncbi:amino acid/amide ABC transporter ATP-binding protein 2, HAAT family (TC 3.A.1.4.-) [Roseibium hamelinense]|uniref:Amino acid/amide ABC transporter ATP-binding protein 2, HAAT family (TC 3.A.1.4.-) n=1 Tax=Roseibium hamelinense TaxID=150831 RepID=A0A562T794_9HYPH|nr:ABC transporter ATP-binding protein [Roseibium hamelinense]TWI89459.1 amino acid/amide ABC transporter ATP-binding protein 2, HAAT family (TC 3.A.1.4.-) [Roseibium hamelinense]
MSRPLLSVDHLQSGYDGTPVLFDVSLTIGEGEVVTLMGRNGMGKSTTIKTVMGLVPATGGEVYFEGRRVDGAPAYDVARQGLGLVPEGRQVFPTLNVEENLVATSANRAGGAARWSLKTVYALFPRLAERRAHFGSQLSGGEQQMLAIGRALMTNPKLLILDEATEGLAPLIRKEIWQVLADLKDTGLAILVVDKSVAALERLADRHVVLEKGRTVWTGSRQELAANPDVKDRYLGA